VAIGIDRCAVPFFICNHSKGASKNEEEKKILCYRKICSKSSLVKTSVTIGVVNGPL
jgi:hypothetical protein